MKQLQGKYTNAVFFTDLVEQEALEQIKVQFATLRSNEAKRLGRHVQLRPNWENVKLPIMEDMASVESDVTVQFPIRNCWFAETDALCRLIRNAKNSAGVPVNSYGSHTLSIRYARHPSAVYFVCPDRFRSSLMTRPLKTSRPSRYTLTTLTSFRIRDAAG